MSSKNVMIARRIRKFREEKNYSQEYMASKLELTQKGYSRIESGQVSISAERLLEISKLLERNITEFFGVGEHRVVFEGNSVNHGIGLVNHLENYYITNKELLEQLASAQKTIDNLTKQLFALNETQKKK